MQTKIRNISVLYDLLKNYAKLPTAIKILISIDKWINEWQFVNHSSTIITITSSFVFIHNPVLANRIWKQIFAENKCFVKSSMNIWIKMVFNRMNWKDFSLLNCKKTFENTILRWKLIYFIKAVTSKFRYGKTALVFIYLRDNSQCLDVFLF